MIPTREVLDTVKYKSLSYVKLVKRFLTSIQKSQQVRIPKILFWTFYLRYKNFVLSWIYEHI